MEETTREDMLKAIQVHGLPEPPAGVRPSPDDMLSATELAARLKQATRTVERWHRKGVLLGIKVDNVLLFYWPSVVARLVAKFQEREKPEPLPRPTRTLSHPMAEGVRGSSTPHKRGK